MRKTAIFMGLAIAAISGAAQAGTYVKGYTKSNGTYVAPHFQSAPDRTQYNNYSTQGNVNPYTGTVGTKAPEAPAYKPYKPYTPPTYKPYGQ